MIYTIGPESILDTNKNEITNYKTLMSRVVFVYHNHAPMARKKFHVQWC